MLLLNSTIGGVEIGLLKNIALMIFFVIFLGILLRLVFSARDRYDDAARIPLNDDEIVTPRRPAKKEEPSHG